MAVVIDIVSSIVAKAKEYVIDPIKNQMNCISNHENNVKSLVHKVVSLEEARERVLHAVDAATRKGEKIEHDVQRWLTTVDKIIAEDVRKVMEYEEKAKKKCFVGLCPNLGARSKLSMEAEKVAKAVSKLLSQRNFDRVSYRVGPHGIIAASFEGFKAFGSRTLILNGIMEALQDDSIKIVGVYGMAGVGKTTLVKEVAQLVMERNLIDSVLMAFVTVTPDVKEIQTQIADLLGLKFEEQSMVVRALQLRERLSKERKILVVLDDIWARLDVKEVGIPFGNEHEGCKIILTSRSLDVLSSGMGTQKNFAVHVLNEEEAWDMFKETAGDDVQSRDLLPIAIKVAKECAGLPLAITTVATTLKNKSLFVWKNALLQMKNLSFRSIGAGNLYSAIELSYNCLESEEVKAIFLLCGFIGHHGLIEDLLKYAFGLGCLRFVRTVEEARDSVLTAVTVLKASCLLLDSNDNERFDIHNIVLGFAMSIASRDYNVLVRDGVVLEQGYMEMENRSWINLRYPRVREFPDEVKCPHLSLFCMATDNSVKIPATFFEQTKRLKILDLTGMHFSYLPGSIYPLKNLHTLRLHQCALKDITIIGGLKNLKVLSLAQSDINALPWEIAQLTRLNLLDLSNCTKLEIIPPNVLLKLSMLEELYMDNSFVQWEDEALGSKRRNASLGELNYLSHLTTLYAHIPNAQIIPERLFIETLKRYRIFIGGDAWDWSSEFEYSRTLKFRLYTSISLGHGVEMLLEKTEDLYLDQLECIKNVLTELNSGEDFSHLKKLHIQNGLEVQYIATENNEFSQLQSMTLQELPQLISFSSEEKTYLQKHGNASTKPLFNEQIVFPSLEDLHLSRLNIERIWPIQLATTSYFAPSLRTLIVDGCGNLKYLLSLSVARCLVQLRRLEIIDCRSMVQVVETEEKLYEIAYMISFPCLTTMKIKDLPELTGFYSGNDNIVFPSLEEVTVECCPNMKIFCNGVLETPKLRNVQISEREHIGCRVGDLNTAIRQFDIEKLKKRDKAEGEGELMVEVGISGKQGEEAVQQEAMLKEKKIEILLSSPIDMSSRAIKYEKDQRAVPEKAEEINEAEVISERDPEFGKIQRLPDDVEVNRERTSTPVEKPLSATEHVPSLAAENLEIIPDENEGTFSSHEIEMEAAHRQKEEDLEETENVSQPSEPASTLALSTPSNREIVEPVAAIPPAKDDIPVMDEAEAEILSQSGEVQEIYETRVAAMTNIEHSVSRILECMGSTETVRKLAVHGVCGVGKSTVLRALVNNPKTKHKFDLIIWVTVSKYWSRRKIQDQIIQQLPPASSNAEPFQILKGQKFLLLLDDVWERIDLQEMGIPDPSQENGSMMILSTRELKACHDAGEIRVVQIEPLSKEEAWTLFREQVGGVVDLPSINHFAKGIVEGCCGLPLLIIVTGRALVDEKNVPVWEHALNEFSEPGRDVKSRMEDLVQLLKFSFYRLKSRSLKSCFLYRALFSEDQQISPSEFVDYCIQEGLIAGSWSNAYERGHDILDALLRALLLETTEGGRLIKMRDVMRDLALEILSSDTEGCQFLQRTYSKPLKPEDRSSSTSADGQYLSRVVAGLTEPPTEEEWEQSEIMFLMNDKLSALPDKPSCSKLVTLFLQRNYQLRVLPDLFFHNMPLLKLLNLSKTRIKYLPKSISNLERLETLILRDCERLVKLPSEVGSLKLLQVLDLRGTEIIELPEEIAELDSLSYLEVSFYGSSTNSKHAKLPPGLISRLEALETLSISVYPGDNWWNKSVESFIKEVINLKLLTSLSFYFPEVKFLEQFLGDSASWKEESLTEFKFVVGADIKFNASRVPQHVELNYGLISGQCLRFVNSEKIPDAIVNVLARCTAFYLHHHLDVHRLSEFGIGNIKKLKYCIISECPDLETIVDSEEGTESVFPCLEYLSIHYSWSLTSIWKGVVPKGSFAALRTLSLYACPKLTYVFKSSMLQFISNLEELLVDDCEAIEKIISVEEVTESCCISLKSLTLQYLPKLVHIWEDAQTRLLFEYISVYDCPQLKQICKDSELKQTLRGIRAEKDWWDELVWEENGIHSHFEALFTPIGEGGVHSS